MNRPTYYAVKINTGHSYGGANEGGIAHVTEPIARTLIRSGVATAVDDLPPETKASEPGTKKVSAAKVTAKAV